MDDRARVAELLGRDPRGDFDVVVRDATGDPVVVRNAPFLDDGTPMPTLYYLVGVELVKAVSRIEADGAVDEVEAELDADEIAAIHRRYERERDAEIDPDHAGPLSLGRRRGDPSRREMPTRARRARARHRRRCDRTLDPRPRPPGTAGAPATPDAPDEDHP